MVTNLFTASPLALSRARDTEALKEVWSTVNAASCPHFYNFHLHTRYSDGQLTPEALIQQAVDLGLQGLAITDHHTVKGYQVAQSYLEGLPQSVFTLPQLWTGIEITSNLNGTEVHILGYGFDHQHPVLEPYVQGHRPLGKDALAANVIAALHQAGGLVVLAHPFRYRRSGEELIPWAAELGIDGLETYYAYQRSKPWQPSPKQTHQAKLFAQKYGLWRTCGTDSHGTNLLLRV